MESTKKYTLGMYEKAVPASLSWKEKLQAAKTAGYDFFEISIDETDEKLRRLDWSSDEKLALLSESFKLGIPITSMCLSAHRKYPLGSENPETEKKSLHIMQKALALSQDLGIRVIMLAGYDVYYEDSTPATKKRFAKNLALAVEMAAKAGVILAFETMETPFMNTCCKAMQFVHAINSPFLQVYPDIGNITNAALSYQSDVLADLQLCKGHIVGLHLKETVPGKFRDMMYGDGHVDFEAHIQTAWQMGVRRFVTEFWCHKTEGWEQDLRFAQNFAASILTRQI